MAGAAGCGRERHYARTDVRLVQCSTGCGLNLPAPVRDIGGAKSCHAVWEKASLPACPLESAIRQRRTV